MSFEKDASNAADDAFIEDQWGAITGACEQSFIKGAEWGYRKAIEELRSGDAGKLVPTSRERIDEIWSPYGWATWLLERAGMNEKDKTKT